MFLLLKEEHSFQNKNTPIAIRSIQFLCRPRLMNTSTSKDVRILVLKGFLPRLAHTENLFRFLSFSPDGEVFRLISGCRPESD